MEVDLLPRLKDAKKPIETGLVLGHAARLRSIHNASLAANRLQPTVVEIRLVGIHESEHVPETVFHRDTCVVVKLSGPVQQVAFFVPDLIADRCDALFSGKLPANPFLGNFFF